MVSQFIPLCTIMVSKFPSSLKLDISKLIWFLYPKTTIDSVATGNAKGLMAIAGMDPKLHLARKKDTQTGSDWSPSQLLPVGVVV